MDKEEKLKRLEEMIQCAKQGDTQRVLRLKQQYEASIPNVHKHPETKCSNITTPLFPQHSVVEVFLKFI